MKDCYETIIRLVLLNIAAGAGMHIRRKVPMYSRVPIPSMPSKADASDSS